MSETTFEDAVRKAAEIGAEHGTNAVGWWEQDAIGGRASGDTAAVARQVLRMLDDGDPAVYDSLPGPDLSGEWADGYTPRQLVKDCGIDPDIEDQGLVSVETELCDEYCNAFCLAVESEVVRVCTLQTAD